MANGNQPPQPKPVVIEQPKLRPLGPNERIVKCAGLKFILPNPWKEGDVLDAQSAALINTAYHTLVLNRFSTQRDEIMKDPRRSYEMLHDALQDHFDEYKWTPRPHAHPDDEIVPLDEHQRKLVAYAREAFNRKLGRQGIPRAEYEAELRQFVLENEATLSKAMAAEEAAMEKLMNSLGGA